MPNLRIKQRTHKELFKLKSLAQIQAEREIPYDELLQNMIGLYQQLVRDGKITWSPTRRGRKTFTPKQVNELVKEIEHPVS